MIGIGTILYGFCNGFFGRDSYGPKTIEAMGCDWVVARDESGTPLFAHFHNSWKNKMPEMLQAWVEDCLWEST